MRFIVTLILTLLIAGPRFQPDNLAADLSFEHAGPTTIGNPAWTDADNDDSDQFIPALHALSEPFASVRVGIVPVAELEQRIEWATTELYTLHLALLI